MAHDLFKQFGTSQQRNERQQLQNIAESAKQKQNSFRGNPRAEVEKLIASGQMSREQFNQYAQIANQTMPFMR